MILFENYLLSLIAFSPLIGILILLFVHHSKEKAIKTISILVTLIPLVLSFMLIAQMDFNQESYKFQFTEDYKWIEFNIPLTAEENFSINYQLGVDGLSAALIVLTTILSTLAAIASLYIKKRWKEYFILFFILQIGMLGVFMSMNLFLFFVFFEFTIIAMFFLIGIWGYNKRESAANQFLLYNGIGSAIMLIAFIAIFMRTGTTYLPAVAAILGHFQMDPTFKMWAFIALFVAFGIKLPVFPLHSWMLKVHVQAPPAIVILHSGILLKLGAYGLFRLGIGLFPEQVYEFSFAIAVLGAISIIYGAVLAFVQKDLKMMLAYSSVSHMGIVLLGIGAVNYSGLQGAVFQSISHGLISALLFFMIAVIYERTKTTMIPELGGLAKSMPVASGVFLAAAMANLGLPGMSGFISEFLTFLGIFKTYPVVAVVGVIGIILTAAYLLRTVLNATFGPTPEQWNDLKDLRGFEYFPVIVLLGYIILIGVYPAVLSEMIHQPVDMLIKSLLARIGGM